MASAPRLAHAEVSILMLGAASRRADLLKKAENQRKNKEGVDGDAEVIASSLNVQKERERIYEAMAYEKL